MPKFKVYGTLDIEWVVDAEDADAAEDLVDAGEAGSGNVTGYGVANVVTDGKEYDAPDEREACLCGHLTREHYGLFSGEPDSRSKPHPMACSTYSCDCLEPIAVSADVVTEPVSS
jgi:hypothetical protein